LVRYEKNYSPPSKKAVAISKMRARIKVRYIHNVQQTRNYGGNIMAYKITDACVKCGACADQCPVEAISEGEATYEINPDVCVSCGACADQCPVEAIVEE
jgi:NAD-dependent dihydropyrimidine dehydrogenase PreA subunit